MTFRKIIGTFLKYLPFIGILAIYVYSLYRGTIITDMMERNIRIWTDSLMISAIVGEIGSLLVLDRFNILLTGKTPNFIQDIKEENSQNFAVMYNGLISSTLFLYVILGLYIISIVKKNRFFSYAAVGLSTLWAIGFLVYIIAEYLKLKNTSPYSIFSKLSNPAILPTIICLIQILVTRKKWVGYIYNNIYMPANDIILSLALIIILCYFLAIAFCHFSNIYCLIGFVFLKRDLDGVQRKIDRLQNKEENQEVILRQATKDIDALVEQINCIKKTGLIFYFFFVHIKTYVQGGLYAVAYLLLLLNLKITKLFASLLNPNRIRIIGIRFCLVTAVLELLSLDFFLFVYLESDNPCLKFFELLSTVIIIPILLSWLAEMKLNAHERNRNEAAKEK